MLSRGAWGTSLPSGQLALASGSDRIPQLLLLASEHDQ